MTHKIILIIISVLLSTINVFSKQTNTIIGFLIKVEYEQLSYCKNCNKNVISYYLIDKNSDFVGPGTLDPIDDVDFLKNHILLENAIPLGLRGYAYIEIAGCCDFQNPLHYRNDQAINIDSLRGKYKLPDLLNFDDAKTQVVSYTAFDKKVSFSVTKVQVNICSCPYNSLISDTISASGNSNIILEILRTYKLDLDDLKLLNKFMGLDASMHIR